MSHVDEITASGALCGSSKWPIWTSHLCSLAHDCLPLYVKKECVLPYIHKRRESAPFSYWKRRYCYCPWRKQLEKAEHRFSWEHSSSNNGRDSHCFMYWGESLYYFHLLFLDTVKWNPTERWQELRAPRQGIPMKRRNKFALGTKSEQKAYSTSERYMASQNHKAGG